MRQSEPSSGTSSTVLLAMVFVMTVVLLCGVPAPVRAAGTCDGDVQTTSNSCDMRHEGSKAGKSGLSAIATSMYAIVVDVFGAEDRPAVPVKNKARNEESLLETTSNVDSFSARPAATGDGDTAVDKSIAPVRATVIDPDILGGGAVSIDLSDGNAPPGAVSNDRKPVTPAVGAPSKRVVKAPPRQKH